VRKADSLPPLCAVVTKSGSLNFEEPSGPVQAYNGTDLPFLTGNIFGFSSVCVCVCVCVFVYVKEKHGAVLYDPLPILIYDPLYDSALRKCLWFTPHRKMMYHTQTPKINII